MLQPIKTKFRKAHKGRIRGQATSGQSLAFGEYGLKAIEPERVTARQIEAARRALTRGGAPRAVACLRRALAEPPAGAERAAIVLELASAELQAGEPAAAAGHFDEGVRVTADPRSRAAYVRERALALAAGGRRDEAFAVCARAADEVAPLDRELALLLEADLIAQGTSIGKAGQDDMERSWQAAKTHERTRSGEQA